MTISVSSSDELIRLDAFLSSRLIQFSRSKIQKLISEGSVTVNDKTVKKIKNNGLKIYTWTVNNKDDINFMKKLKVDGIISDYPDRI